MTPDQAIQSVSQGKQTPGAWETIYSALRPRLIAYSSDLLLTFRMASDAAPDLVQEAFLSVLQKWSEKGKMPAASMAELERYLRATCRNLLIDRYRHEKAAASLMDFLELSFDRAFGEEVERYRSIFVKQLIQRMPEPCATLLRRYVEEDITPAQMAEDENAPVATFYSRWYRCTQKARVSLAETPAATGQ